MIQIDRFFFLNSMHILRFYKTVFFLSFISHIQRSILLYYTKNLILRWTKVIIYIFTHTASQQTSTNLSINTNFRSIGRQSVKLWVKSVSLQLDLRKDLRKVWSWSVDLQPATQVSVLRSHAPVQRDLD